jgi:hypothetical protein
VVQLTLPSNLVRNIDRWAEVEGRRRHGARVTRSQAVRELCAFALDHLAAIAPIETSPSKRTVRVYRLGEEPQYDDQTENMTPEERVALVSDLSLDSYAMRGDHVVPGIRRDVVRIVRRWR